MKIKCDICGGELVMLAGGKGGACKVCGMEHSVERIREMLGMSEPVTEKAEEPVKKAVKKELVKEVVTPAKVEEPEIVEVDDVEIIEVDEVELVEEEEEYVELTETDESDFVIKKRFGSTELKGYNGNAQRVIFPDKPIEISDCSIFDGHDEIVELVFQGGFSNTGCEKGIFAGLKNLKRVICMGDMLAFDGEFKGCENLEEVIITNAQLIQLNGAVFADCVKLKNIELDENAEMEIGPKAFKNCKSLKAFVHPKKSVYFTGDGIGRSAFEGCTSLRDVVLADDTTAIHKDAFKNCTSLESVTTHSGDLSGIAIHPNAFDGSSFKPEKVGVCPKCNKKLNCSDKTITCSCGFESIQYED